MPTIPGTWLEGPVTSLPDPLPAVALVMVTHEGLPVTLLRTFRQTRAESLSWAQDPAAGMPAMSEVQVLERACSLPTGWGGRPPRSDVSLVIPTMGEPGRLEPLLDSLASDLPSLREVIVVVNGVPVEPVAHRVQALCRDPRVQFMSSAPGLSAARNAGIDRAEGEYVALLDDDVRVAATWRRGIDRAVAAHPGTDLITGSVIATPPTSEAQFWFETVGGFRKGFDELVVDGRGLSRGQALVLASRVGTGAAMILRRAAGLRFAEVLGAGTLARGGEDLDLVVTVLVRGGTVVFAPDILVRHPAPAHWPALRRQSFAYGRGLAAMTVHQMVTGAVPAREILAQVPAAVATVARRSGYAQDASEPFPISYRVREAAGLVVGTLDYARSALREPAG